MALDGINGVQGGGEVYQSGSTQRTYKSGQNPNVDMSTTGSKKKQILKQEYYPNGNLKFQSYIDSWGSYFVTEQYHDNNQIATQVKDNNVTKTRTIKNYEKDGFLESEEFISNDRHIKTLYQRDGSYTRKELVEENGKKIWKITEEGTI